MAKRMSANERKRTAAQRGTKRPRHTLRRVTVVLVALAAAAAALCFGAGRYGGRLQALALRFDFLKPVVAQQMVIKGAVQVNPAELLKRSGIVFPIRLEQLKKVHLGALRNASPWIDKIRIVTVRNGTIVLGISERIPVALLQASGGLCLVDAKGVCLPLCRKTGYALPLVSGLQDSTGGDGIRRLAGEGAARMNRFFRDVAAGDASFAKGVTQVNFDPEEEAAVRVMLEGSSAVVVMSENCIAEGLEKYAGLRETVQGDSLRPVRIDLAYRNLAFVTTEPAPKPAAGAGEPVAKKTKA